MTTTEFLGLILTDRTETSMPFLEWRTLMNGTDGNSNMELIDGAISRLNTAIGGKADGFSFSPDTGVLQLTSDGVPIDGASVTINLNNYYTKTEVDEILAELEESFANNETIQALMASAVSDLEWDETSRALTMYNMNGEQIGDTITIEGGGGGGTGTSYSVRIINGMPSSTFTAATSAKTIIKATFYEYYGTDSTGVNGTLEVTYKLSTDETWLSLGKQTVQQGVPFSIDVTDILTEGKTTSIKFTVVGGESEITRSLTYNVTQVEASIAAVNFDTAAVYTGNVSFQYKCVGRNLQKTVYFIIDGEEYTHVDVGTSHNTTLTQPIEMAGNYDYGAHDFQVYFETADGALSNILNFTLLYNDGSSTEPMIGVILDDDTVTYGDTITATYVVYTPNQETTDELNIRVYAINEDGEEENYFSQHLVNIDNNTAYEWQGTLYPESGTAYIEFTSGNTEKIVSVQVNEIQSEYDLDQIETGLVYQYNAAGRSNNDSSKDTYTCEYTTSNGVTTNIKGLFDGFNWVSNGYVDGESLTLSGTAVHTIKLPMFSTSYVDDDGQTINLESATGATVTTNGRTFEIDFQVSNVTDINAQIIKCMSSDHAGFIVTPQTCYLLSSNGANVALDDTGFIENEESIAAAYIKDNKRIRLSFVIEPTGSVEYTDSEGTTHTGQCVNIYINGQFANSFPYEDNARFAQSEYITLGSNTCIMNVYDVRIYNRGLSTTEIMQNYKASPLSVQDRIIRFEDNDVLTDEGDVDYNKAIYKYPCLLITGSLSPYKGANGIKTEGKTEAGATLTKPDGNGGYSVEFDLLDKDSDGVWVSSNNVQGTSSVKFPIKNYKVYLAKNEVGEDGTVTKKKVKYSLKGVDEDGNDISIGESTLCWKGDYMSSDHANTFNANLADTLFDDVLISQNPSLGGDSRVQNTIYGFRCLLFRRDDIGENIEFIGDGALNNDKGNTATFGLECDGDEGNDTLRQKWEFLNNTEALCSFLTDRFFELVDGKKRVLAGLESTYPDQGDLKDEGLEPKYDHLQVLYTWVCQRANFWDASTDTLSVPLVYKGVSYTTERDYRKAIFINEFELHFNKNHALIYYLFNEFVALCDNRAKNMFLRCEDVRCEQLLNTSGEEMSIYDAINMETGEVDASMIDWENSTFAVWICDLYDLDSCFGVENSGYMQIPYYADWHYHLNGTQKFNGRESVFWLMFEEALADEIEDKAQLLTDRSSGNGGLNYESLYDYHIKNNAMLVCPAVVNRDMEHKYSDPWTEGYVDYASEGHPVRHISDYKYLQRGSRTEQKDAFIYRRSNMLYSKYKCNKFLNNNINFRVGTNGGVLATNSGITVTASQALYPAVKYGDGDAAVISVEKTAAGIPVTITKPGTTTADKVGFSDTVYIAGGTFLTDIGDISKFRPYELQLQNATGLKKLTIGSAEDGYTNAQLKSIDTSGCKILEELNIMGCTSLGTVNLSKNGLIRKIYAGNSSASSISLPNGGILEELYLGTVSDIEILNHTHLEAFTCDSYANLTALRVENTPNVPTMEMVAERLPYLTGGLRLVGIDETIEDTKVLEMLLSDDALGKYIDNNGVLSESKTIYPFISGTIHCDTIGSYLKSELEKVYPNLVIDATSVVQQYVVTFVNYDGSTLDKQYVIRGGRAEDPTTREDNPIATPTRPSTVSTNYTFDGWDTDLTTTVVSSDLTVSATYSETTRQYTVKWYNGSTLLQKSTVLYGEGAEYTGDIPEDTSQEEYLSYRLFDGWDNNTGSIEGDLDVHAKFTEAVAPTDKALSEMTPTELYALIKTGKLSPSGENNDVITSGDEFDLVMGHDLDFDNVESTEFIALGDTKTFDGTSGSIINTGVNLFDEDKSFVLAIDFSFSDTTTGATLASCYQNNMGFKLTYTGSGAAVKYGSTNSTAVASQLDREMVVIRHIKGDTNLYVYGSNKMKSMVVSKVTRTLSSIQDAPLAFGCTMESDGYKDEYAKGKIYWAKLWMSDLGETNCKKLAAWTRETLTMQAAGTSENAFRLFTGTDDGRYCNCAFLMKNLLDKTHVMNTSNVNSGGWKECNMRAWLTSRVPNGLPAQWQLILKKVDVRSSTGNMTTTDFSTSSDYVWIPSAKEVNFSATTAPYSGESDGKINFFTDNNSRIKYLNNGAGAVYSWWLRSPGAGYTTDFYIVHATGGHNHYNASSSYGVCFGFCI